MGSKLKRKQIVKEYKETHPCVDCGEDDPVVLQFDHRDPTEKVDKINNIMSNKGIAALMTEIAKCDVRCANCHQRRHACDGS